MPYKIRSFSQDYALPGAYSTIRAITARNLTRADRRAIKAAHNHAFAAGQAASKARPRLVPPPTLAAIPLSVFLASARTAR
jgi:hypothetical protein